MPLPKAPPKEKEPKAQLPDSAKRLWSIGASAGTSFYQPRFVGTVQGTLAVSRYTFIDIGADIGLGSGYSDVDYLSFYPFTHYAAFVPFSVKSGWYIGAGLGYLLAQYSFPEGDVMDTTFAFDLCTGFVIRNIFTISYNLRTNGSSADSKLALGIIYRFGQRGSR